MTTLADQIADQSPPNRPLPGEIVQWGPSPWLEVVEGYQAAIARLIEILDGYELAAEQIKAERDRVKLELEQIRNKRMAP